VHSPRGFVKLPGRDRAGWAKLAGCADFFFPARRRAGLPAGYYNVAIGLNQQQEAAASVGRAAFACGAGTGTMQVVKGLFFMEKWLCWGSMGVAGLLLLLFVLDVTIKIPFGGISPVVDIVSIVASTLVLYLAWDAFKDLR
jgi:hypothetical protein